MAEADHSTRAHATWSASATAGNWACPGRLALTMDAVDVASEAADWGTACHQISEACLRENIDADSFVGRTIKAGDRYLDVDDEMAETAQTYVDYVRGRLDKHAALEIETRFSLQSLDPPFDAGGTCDAIVISKTQRSMEVIDLKGGRGVVVEAAENPQLRTYALGAMIANPGLGVDQITVTIVQPRAPHKDGRIRSETFHVADLIEWTSDLVEAMQKAKTALDARAKMDGALWSDSFLRAGPHCEKSFCAARSTCPAYANLALAVAGAWFSPIGELEIAPRDNVDEMTPERVAEILNKADILEDWINVIRARGKWLAESGVEVPGYQLVDKQARRKWTDEAAVLARAAALGVTVTQDKLLSPAQLEKKLKKQFAEFAPFVDKSSSGQNLVAVAKSSRPAAVAPAHQFLAPIFD